MTSMTERNMELLGTEAVSAVTNITTKKIGSNAV